MKAETRVEKTVVLQLNEEEAEWLKELVQNPVFNENESEKDTRIRMGFWNALNQDNPNLQVDPKNIN